MCHPMTSLSPDLTINRKDCSCNKPDYLILTLSGVGKGSDNGRGDGERYISALV